MGFQNLCFLIPLIKLPSSLSCFIPLFLKAGVSKVMDLIDLTQCEWRTVLSIAAQVKLKSVRTVDRIIKCIKDAFPPALTSFINAALVNGFFTSELP